jgi:coenzyme Q-binding protein COQ10
VNHSESRIVPYTADLLFAVVTDVERYPEFLPWIRALRILSRGESRLTAEMAVGYGPFRERYVSLVTLDPIARTVDAVAIKGPFRQLENHWRFTPEGAGCRIDFSIQFEFANPLLQAAAQSAFEKVLLKMIDSFVARAAFLNAKTA